MVISHHYARRHQNEINAAVWKDYLLVEHLRRILQREEGKLDEKAKRVISDYIAKATSRDAIRVDQNKALTILLQYSRPRIIICTLGKRAALVIVHTCAYRNCAQNRGQTSANDQIPRDRRDRTSQ